MAEERSLLYLPDDLKDEILVRLPVKSIIRFESVCKRWYSLFRSKAFPKFYLASGDHQLSIPTVKDLHLIYPELRQRTTMLAIGPLSNGIYALPSVLTPRKDRPVFFHTLKIALLNPATRRIKFASPFPDEYVSLLARISSHHCSVSIGMDDDYRVVVFVNYEKHGGGWLCFLVLLYTWRTEVWERLVDYNRDRHKRIGLPPPPATHVFQKTNQVLDDMMACSQKLFNGCWHWMTIEITEGYYNVQFGVLSFDFCSKSFRLIPGPRCEVTASADVFVLHDHLCGIVVDGPKSRCEIWMKTRDPKTTWANIYSVDIGHVFRSFEAILHEVDYYRIQESERIRIRRVVLINTYERFTFDEEGHLVREVIEPSKEISLSVGGISKFIPTFERLPLN